MRGRGVTNEESNISSINRIRPLNKPHLPHRPQQKEEEGEYFWSMKNNRTIRKNWRTIDDMIHVIKETIQIRPQHKGKKKRSEFDIVPDNPPRGLLLFVTRSSHPNRCGRSRETLMKVVCICVMC